MALQLEHRPFRILRQRVDFCVVGGGLACRRGLTPHACSTLSPTCSSNCWPTISIDLYLPGVVQEVGATTRTAHLEASQGERFSGRQRPAVTASAGATCKPQGS